jgi:PAS domain S-box-containing protein
MPTKKSSSQAGMERGSRAIVAPEQNVSSDLIKEISSLNQALRLEGEKVRAVLSSMADPLLMYDAEGILTDASDTATEIFGFDPRGMHQRDILEKIDLRMLDGRRMKFPEMASVRALHGEILRNFIFTFRDKDGKRRVALCSAAPIRAGEKITGVVAYWLDATEQKKMEADLAWESEVNASMADLARILLRPSALENISYLVLQHAKKLTNSVYGFAGYVDPATGDFICPTLAREIWKDCEVTDKKSIFRALSSKSSLIGRVWEDKKPLVANSVSCDARAGGLPKGHIPIERFLAVPAIFGDARVGMIGLANSEHAYSEKDLVVAERLAALYAIAI